ncbi:predicted protein [Uncinocarpus reesii 1704]|uniref:DUF4470 domain-containing protein n=1 Tax=Uncinocarpus reesii (strain UAMH 1704) TaxID=336963 RepID=C4JQL0_UNCRE|nr:uncharacterized protein UREG_03355 [Uncinocarpus reesii 1704]EEP78509.1 predicted protein [Uncinocarpus reesii 1704]
MGKPTWRPAWETERRSPSFITSDVNTGRLSDQVSCGAAKYLWGNMPALDLLNLNQNEGVDDTSQDFHLLFAASGDLRNLMKTVAALPESYTGTLNVTFNDLDFDIVARNVVFLLTALTLPTEKATPIILHLWYSALIPAEILTILDKEVLPLIDDVCKKISTKPVESLQAKTWKCGERSLHLVLQKHRWVEIRNSFTVPKGLSLDKARSVRKAITMAPARVDNLHRGLFSQPPFRRVSKIKFRENGILLPFGSCRARFDTPNPTHYHGVESWRMLDSADPLDGWKLEEIVGLASQAKNDIYGALFFHVKDLILKFCRRIMNMKFHIDLYQISNISDGGYLGLNCSLATFGPMLKRASDNPRATLLLLFMNAVEEMSTPGDVLSLTNPAFCKVFEHYIPECRQAMHSGNREQDAALLKGFEALTLFRDFDQVFDRYMHYVGPIPEEYKMKIKAKHTIVPRWPLRLRKNATKQEFDMEQASGQVSSSRYLEWVRAE